VNLRPAVEGDVAAVVLLERSLFGADAWSESVVRAELLGDGRYAVVAVSDGNVVGYAVTREAGDVLDLQRIAVHPAHRRTGLARAMLERVAAASRQSQQRMLLEVSAANLAARGFYEAEGFREIARRRRYYRDGTDALVLELLPGEA
jgi:ribosomal-protein-alanine N-acetyltransferase